MDSDAEKMSRTRKITFQSEGASNLWAVRPNSLITPESGPELECYCRAYRCMSARKFVMAF